MRTIDFANEIHDLASKLETEAINYVSQFDKKATLMVENTESTINRIKEDDVDFASQPQDLNDSFARADDILMRNLAVSVVADERLKEISETLRKFRAEFFPKLARIRRKEEDFSTDKPGSRCRKREHPEQAGCSFWSSDSMVESPRKFNRI